MRRPVDMYLVKVPERHVAALRFPRRWTQSSFSSKTRELLDELEKEASLERERSSR